MTDNIKHLVIDELDSRVGKGNKTGEEQWAYALYLDYRDRELDASIIKEIARAEDPRGFFYELTDTAFSDSVWNEEKELLEAIKTVLDEAAQDYDEDELREYIQEHVDIYVPADEILRSNSVCINIIIDTGDANYEFTKNSFAHSYYGGEGIEEESSLLWLAKQQGGTEEDLKRAFNYGTALDADSLKIQREYEEAQKALEALGKRDAYGHRNDLNQEPFKSANYIQIEISKCNVQIASAEKSLSQLPATYDDYLHACDERGMQTRMSAESFSAKRAEIIEKAESRIKACKDHIASLNSLGVEKQLGAVFEAMETYKSAATKHIEMFYTEQYKRCRMLDSLIECSASTTSGMNALTFCVKMPLSEYLDLREAMQQEESLNRSSDPAARKGSGEIVLSGKTHAILYDAWSGAGSCSDIELCSDVHLPIRLIHSANPDGMDGYGVMEIYGVNDDFYTDTLKEIQSMREQSVMQQIACGKSLNEKIALAAAEKHRPESNNARSVDLESREGH